MGKRHLPEISVDADDEKNLKEWEEAVCPVCMEPPHNAVLLQCSSLDRGCRPYICNTGVRHSGCLRRFYESPDPSTSTSRYRQASSETSMEIDTWKSSKGSMVMCPFCRGHARRWEVLQSARKYMNSRSRSCSSESCDFSGNYAELRKQVRSKHPSVKFREVDPSRQQLWTRLEQEREIADLLSILRPSEEEEFERRIWKGKSGSINCLKSESFRCKSLSIWLKIVLDLYLFAVALGKRFRFWCHNGIITLDAKDDQHAS